MNLQPMPEARGSEISAEFHRSKQLGMPIVMRKFTKDWPANQWSWDDLCSAVGTRTTGIRGNAFTHGQSTTFFPKPIAQKPIAAYFFGALGSETRIHYDFDWVDLLLSHFKSQKRIWLFNQRQNEHLYQIPGTVHSAIDFSRLSELRESYPNIDRLEGYEVVLEPGDTLYIPKGYWHHITYVTGSFSITYRIWPQNLNEWLKTAYSWSVGGIDILLDKLPAIAAWQARRRAKAFEAKYGRPL